MNQNQIFIKAADGRSVRDPETKQLLDEAGEFKPRNGFWLKRLKQGDVIETKPTRKTVSKGD
ncbi:DUF2635 domain-containing protein [Ignatzschineria cameli]|uniref:DUF2635 domain-containing protein n=1 Tax=Ignatzschineria cameli TaxID=2182793 RepID=A0ABX5L180_9GAMM|nr:DUF2635 domain-containing protein [Ignatzschineria cameli]PWD90547.1 hypothetical protein DC079_04170 [Ignatzschineria cameli]PWD92426.1 hypothetical protein DC081_03875 [Ignatzschineria cameli]PWD93224.1 hypothetical protein DC078_04170 [Ignatzschineria cameli]